MKPFRFLAEARAIASGRELAETARRAEAIGIDTLVIPDHQAEELADALHARSGVRVGADDLLESPHIFIGSVDTFVEKFTRLREELGISSVMVGEVDELVPVVERLAGT